MKKLLMMSALTMAVAMPAAIANDANWDKKIDSKFSEMDADGNGQISKSEHATAADGMFSEADTDKSGSVSKEELKAAKMKEKAKWSEDHKS